MNTQTEKHRNVDIWAGNKMTDRHTNKQTDNKRDRNIYIKTYKKTDRKIDVFYIDGHTKRMEKKTR